MCKILYEIVQIINILLTHAASGFLPPHSYLVALRKCVIMSLSIVYFASYFRKPHLTCFSFVLGAPKRREYVLNERLLVQEVAFRRKNTSNQFRLKLNTWFCVGYHSAESGEMRQLKGVNSLINGK